RISRGYAALNRGAKRVPKKREISVQLVKEVSSDFFVLAPPVFLSDLLATLFVSDVLPLTDREYRNGYPDEGEKEEDSESVPVHGPYTMPPRLLRSRRARSRLRFCISCSTARITA